MGHLPRGGRGRRRGGGRPPAACAARTGGASCSSTVATPSETCSTASAATRRVAVVRPATARWTKTPRSSTPSQRWTQCTEASHPPGSRSPLQSGKSGHASPAPAWRTYPPRASWTRSTARATTMRPPRISSAFTRWVVLTRSGSLSSTVIAPRAIWTTSRIGRSHASRRSPAGAGPRSVTTLVARISPVAARAERRWLYSMSTSARSGGITEPWQRGQSGHARPEPVALTTLPRVMSTKTAATAARAILADMGRGPGRAHRAVGASRDLPAEEDDGEGGQEDHAARDPHDEAAQVLIGLRGEPLPDAGGRRVVRVEQAVRHRDEDGHHHHRQPDHEEVQHLHRVGGAGQLVERRQHRPPQDHRGDHDHEVLHDVHRVLLHG